MNFGLIGKIRSQNMIYVISIRVRKVWYDKDVCLTIAHLLQDANDDCRELEL